MTMMGKYDYEASRKFEADEHIHPNMMSSLSREEIKAEAKRRINLLVFVSKLDTFQQYDYLDSHGIKYTN